MSRDFDGVVQPSITVRRFTRADFPRVMAVERASFGHNAWPEAWLDYYSEAWPRLFLVGIAGGRIVGYSAAAVSRGWGELVSVAVLPRFRRRGIARALVVRTVHLLRRQSIRGVSLTVRADNAPARHLYETLGFRRVRTVRDYYEDGAPGLRMRLPLNLTARPHARS